MMTYLITFVTKLPTIAQVRRSLGVGQVNVAIHTSAVLNRSYDLWTRLAAIHGFSSQEVLEASELGSYVVVDPSNKTALLSLSKLAYEKLLGQCLSNQAVLILLLSPLDSKTPTGGPEASGEPHQPTPQKDLEDNTINSWTEFARSTSPHRLNRVFFTKIRKSSYIGYVGLGVSRVSKWVAGQDWTTVQPVLQRWSTRLLYWSGMTRSRYHRSGTISFLRVLRRVHLNSGIYGLCIYLKSCTFIVYKFLSGTPVRHSFSETGVPVKLANGLPACLPVLWRNSIRRGDTTVIRIVVSILYSYKAFYAQAKKPADVRKKILDGIQTPMPVVQHLDKFSDFCRKFYRYYDFPEASNEELTPDFFHTAVSAGPMSPISILGLGADCKAWSEFEKINAQRENKVYTPLDFLRHFNCERLLRLVEFHVEQFDAGNWSKSYTVESGVPPELLETVNNALQNEGYSPLRDPSGKYQSVTVKDMKSFAEDKCFPFGSLCFLEEAAGKIRVVALVDALRQTCLRPIHDFILQTLGQFPGDATFDQSGAVRKFASYEVKQCFSYDLSKATDMIPFLVYKPVLEPLIGGHVFDMWADLMTKYEFVIPDYRKDTPRSPVPTRGEALREGYRVLYKRGQPMGALSSWGALALFHHMLVQYAYYLWSLTTDPLQEYPLEYVKFSQYLVLGDDIVIGHQGVAEKYLELCKEFEIPISLTKSFVSDNGFFSFASEYFRGSVCLSPLSLREDMAAQSLPARVSFARRMLTRGWLTASVGLLAPKAIMKAVLTKTSFMREWNMGVNGVVSPVSTKIHQLLATTAIAEVSSISLPEWLRSQYDSNRGLRSMFTRTKPLTQRELTFAVYVLQMVAERLKEKAELLCDLFPPSQYTIMWIAHEEWGFESEMRRIKRLQDDHSSGTFLDYIPTFMTLQRLYNLCLSYLSFSEPLEINVSEGPLAYYVAKRYAMEMQGVLGFSTDWSMRRFQTEHMHNRLSKEILDFIRRNGQISDMFLGDLKRKNQPNLVITGFERYPENSGGDPTL